MTLRELIQRATSTKYTRALEIEVTRLRGENRALLNSILGIAGVPPIVVAENDVSPAAGSRPPAMRVATHITPTSATMRSKRPPSMGSLAAVKSEKNAPVTRRRSWHQIYRMLEINSARKKSASEIV
jgi:hypothetical protein